MCTYDHFTVTILFNGRVLLRRPVKRMQLTEIRVDLGIRRTNSTVTTISVSTIEKSRGIVTAV